MIRAYDEYVNVVDLVEWEREIRINAIDEFVEWLGKHHNYGKCVIDMYVEEYKEQLKERVND